MKTYFGIGELARAVGKSPVSLREKIQAGDIIPDAIVDHEGRRDALFTPETIASLRILGEPEETVQQEVLC